jgi:uncharacterized protein with HEPN domain
MDNVKNDCYYIRKIRNDLQFIVQHMKDVDIEELNANVDLNIVFETLKNDIPELLEMMIKG